MNRNLVIAIAGSLLAHAGFVFGGQYFRARPEPARVTEVIPVIALEALPPIEPDPVELTDNSEPASSDVSDLAPPTQADVPSVSITSPFVQTIQAPPPPGLAKSTGVIAIPTGRPASGLGTGGLGGIFDLASLDQKPVPTFRVPPNFPLEMKRAGISGDVLVGFIVDAEGNTRDAHVIRSSQPEFEGEALRAVLRWKFKPGRKGGVAVSTRMTQPLAFNLAN
jgi:periplasmic protein TonB